MAQSNQRLVLDLDDIERQLREAQSQPLRPAAKSDPLAELARIVGQNDPFRSLIAGEKAERPEPLDREALFVDPPHPPSHAPGLHVSASDRAAPHAGMATDPYAAEDEAYPEPVQEFERRERPRVRKGLIAVGAILGTAVIAVGGAFVLRKPSATTASGEPPVIAASKEPLKVQPENPGGVDIPNQNAQVYERGGQDRQTRIVNREEQPIDVQQAARAAQTPTAGVVPPSTATPGAAPAAPPPRMSQNSVVSTLGEPKRVRTVSVRPDGTIVSPDQPSGALPLPTMPPAPRPVPTAPAAASAGPTMTGATTPSAIPQAAPAPSQPRAATPATASPPASPAAPARPAAPSAAAPSSPSLAAPSAAQPQQQRTAAVPAPKPAETPSAAGGWSVQLSVQPSEEQARKQAQELRQKYVGLLRGRAPMVQTAEVNGKTLYRIRVGPMSQDDAGDLCNRVKAAQGACFIAKN